MRVIVCPHELTMGGSQINAIELAASLRNRGHEVIVYAPPGELSNRVAALGLEHVPSATGTRLSLSWSIGLIRLARKRDADLIHTYEWATSVGGAFGAHSFLGIPQVMTVLSMDIPHFLPQHLPLIVGTEDLARHGDHSGGVFVIEPPVNVHENKPSDYLDARKQWNYSKDEFVVTIACRMADDLGKAEGVLAAIRAVGELSWSTKIRLLLVGDGSAMGRIRCASDEVNQRADRKIVTVMGEMLDPRPAYDAADISVGMGSSALRAMSFGKPVIVQGNEGFCRLVSPETFDYFSRMGFYGTGGNASYELASILAELVSDREYRLKLGNWGRSLVESRYSLDAATTRLECIYRSTVARKHRSVRDLAPLGTSAFRVLKHCVARAFDERAGV